MPKADHQTSTSTALVPFLFEAETLVRVVTRDGNPWFVAADLCKILGIRNTADALKNLDNDEKGIAIRDSLGGNQDHLIVSESGLYALIFRSRKPKAVDFRKWVTSEVLPQIRKTGSYSTTRRPRGLREQSWTVRLKTASEYRHSYGIMAAQWIMTELGFPVPPPHTISKGRQFGLFDLNGDVIEPGASDTTH